MKMSGEEIIAAPIEAVWKALNDPAILKQCIPGCESITMTSPTEMKARVVVKMGPVKAGFNGVVHLKDLNPPNGYRIEGKGEGGLAGHASGGATVSLETVPEGTKMSYDVDAQVGGKMAMLGSRLIDSTARSMAGQFFDKFATLAAHVKADAPVKKAKAPAKKAAKKVVVKKAAAKKAAKKAPAKKAAVKKAPAKKAAVKKKAKKK
jgi:carbon monoxide dehydrogenase subunit G